MSLSFDKKQTVFESGDCKGIIKFRRQATEKGFFSCSHWLSPETNYFSGISWSNMYVCLWNSHSAAAVIEFLSLFLFKQHWSLWILDTCISPCKKRYIGVTFKLATQYLWPFFEELESLCQTSKDLLNGFNAIPDSLHTFETFNKTVIQTQNNKNFEKNPRYMSLHTITEHSACEVCKSRAKTVESLPHLQISECHSITELKHRSRQEKLVNQMLRRMWGNLILVGNNQRFEGPQRL